MGDLEGAPTSELTEWSSRNGMWVGYQDAHLWSRVRTAEPGGHLYSHHFPDMGAEQLAIYWPPSEMNVLFRGIQESAWGDLGLFEGEWALQSEAVLAVAMRRGYFGGEGVRSISPA